MFFIYSVFSFIGYFLVMFVLMGIAILTGKYLISWLFYAVGGILQFLSLLGNTIAMTRSVAEMEGYSIFSDAVETTKGSMMFRWAIYVFIMIVTLLIMRKKRTEYLYLKSFSQQSKPTAQNNQASASPTEKKLSARTAEPAFSASAAANTPGWQCQCGRTNADYLMTCSCGITKQEMKLRKTKVE